jgi:hypothetical protein
MTNDENNDNDSQEEEKQRQIIRLSASVSAGLMCAFSPLMWQYNTSAEVFALHNLFVASIIYALTKYNQHQCSQRLIAFGAYLCGLAMTNQHTSILLIVPVAVWVLLSSAIERKKMILMSAGSFFAGISCYVVLPIFATLFPHAGSWGDVRSIKGFMHHFLRKDYGTMQLWSGGGSNATEGMISRTSSWVKNLGEQQLCHPTLLLFVALGCTSVCFPSMASGGKRKSRRSKMILLNVGSRTATGRVMTAALVFYLMIFHSLANLPLSNPLFFGIHQRFWMHPNIVCFHFVGVGLDVASKVASGITPSKAASGIIPIIMLAIPLATFKSNFDVSDQSENKVFRGYASSILETLPPEALLVINYDQTWTSIRYIQECEGLRGDVKSINLSLMTYPWFKEKQQLYDGLTFPGSHYTKWNTGSWLKGGFTFSEFLDANSDKNVFVSGRLNYEDTDYIERYEEVPFGLVRSIKRREVSVEPAEVYRNMTWHIWSTVSKNLCENLPTETKYPPSTWEWTVRREFVDHLVSRSTYLLDIALRGPQTQSLHSVAEAAAWLEVAIFLDKQLGNSPSIQKNLGLAYMNIVRSKEDHFPVIEDIFGSKIKIGYRKNWWVGSNGDDWKKWATIQWQESWGNFLQIDSARESQREANL